MHLITRLVARPLVALLVFAAVLAPMPMNPAVSPVHAHGGELDTVVRLVPSVLAAVVGWHVGAPLGIVGKVIGAYVGLQVGKFVGRVIANAVGGIFHDHHYSYTPSLWQRIFGGGSYGYGGNPYPWAPGSTTADLGSLREAWLSSVSAYQGALKGGSEADKAAKRATMEAAEKAYFGAKATAK